MKAIEYIVFSLNGILKNILNFKTTALMIEIINVKTLKDKKKRNLQIKYVENLKLKKILVTLQR